MTSNNQIIPINPDILVWARERLNMDLAEVSDKLGQNTAIVTNWENGQSLPSLSQLEKMAYEIYKIPLATFFLPDVPSEPSLNQEFRTIPEAEIKNLPPKFILQVKRAQYYIVVLKELFDGNNPSQSPIFRGSGIDELSIQQKAKYLRKQLNINIKVQSTFKNSTEAFKYYRSSLEKNGIFVFQQTLKNICRGYSLFDTEFPLIVVNSSEISDTGKNFTLFHELSHILHATGGITNNDSYQSDHVVEIECNKLASLILLDTNEFFEEIRSLKLNPGQIEDAYLPILANKFKVSQEVILRRLYDLDLTTRENYENKRKEWLEYLPKKRKSKGGNHFNIKLSQLSNQYSSAVFTKMYEGVLSSYQAAELLNTKINYLPKIEKLIFK